MHHRLIDKILNRLFFRNADRHETKTDEVVLVDGTNTAGREVTFTARRSQVAQHARDIGVLFPVIRGESAPHRSVYDRQEEAH